MRPLRTPRHPTHPTHPVAFRRGTSLPPVITVASPGGTNPAGSILPLFAGDAVFEAFPAFALNPANYQSSAGPITSVTRVWSVNGGPLETY
jgi:hypothetical protein